MNKLIVVLLCMLVIIPIVSAEDNQDFFGIGNWLNNIKQGISKIQITINIPEFKPTPSTTVNPIDVIKSYSYDMRSESEQVRDLNNFVLTNSVKYEKDISERMDKEGIKSIKVNIISDSGITLKSYVFVSGIGISDNNMRTDYYYNVKLSDAMTYIRMSSVLIPMFESGASIEDIIKLIK